MPTKLQNDYKKRVKILAKENNPVRSLRMKLKPTPAEIQNRHWRDRNLQYLLQRELADRMSCSEACIAQCEVEKRLPVSKAILENFNELLKNSKS